MNETTRSGRRRVLPAIGAATAVCLLVAASSSSSNASSSTSTSGGSASADVPANVSAAQKVVAQHVKRPTQAALAPLPPVGKPIPTGKTIDYISCGQPDCTAQGQIVTQADNILGWHTTIIDTDGTPEKVQNAWAQILRQKPNGVITAAFPESEFQGALAQAKAEGIAVSDAGVADPAGNGIVYSDGDQYYHAAAAAMVSWVVANSDGAPNAVFVNVGDYPILAVEQKAFQQEFARQAPKGTLAQLTIPLAAVGTSAPSLYVSYLRSHPKVKYVIPSFDQLYIGVPAALKAAGLTGLKSMSLAVTPTSLQYLAVGQMSAEIGYDEQLQDYKQVDSLARYFAGAPIQHPLPYPVWIISKGDLPPIEVNYPETPGLAEYFGHLWGKN